MSSIRTENPLLNFQLPSERRQLVSRVARASLSNAASLLPGVLFNLHVIEIIHFALWGMPLLLVHATLAALHVY